MRTYSWLAWRTVWGADNRWAAIVQFVAVAGVAFGALVAVAIPGVIAAQEVRSDGLAPRVTTTSDERAKSALLTFDPVVDIERRWDGFDIKRTYYAGNRSTSVPGLQSLPNIDSYSASPALQRLIASNDTIGDLYHGKHLVGTISDEGLVHPHELRSVELVRPDSPLLVGVKGFGKKDGSATGQSEGRGRLNALISVAVFVVVIFPGILLLRIVTQLGAPARQRSALVLRRVGLSKRSTITVAAVGAAIVSLPSAILGGALFNITASSVTSIPGTDFGFYPADSTPPASVQVVAVAVVLVMAITSTVTMPARGGRRPGSSWRLGQRIRRLGRLMLPAGVLLLLATPVLVKLIGPMIGFTIWAGIGLVAVGFVLFAPTAVRRFVSTWISSVKSGGALVGGHLMMSQRSATRVGSLLAVSVILFLGSLSFMTILEGGDLQSWKQRLTRQSFVPVVATDLADEFTSEGIRSVAPDVGVVSLSTPPGGKVPLVYGTCADLSGISGQPADRCTGEPQLITARSQPIPQLPGMAVLGDGTEILMPRVKDRLELTNIPPEFHAAILVSPAHGPPRMTGSGSTFYMVIPASDFVDTLARIRSLVPLAQFDLGSLDFRNPATSQYPAQLACLTLAATIGLAIGAIAVASSIVAEARERSRQLRGLRILGAPPSQMVLAHSIGTVGALLVLTLMSLALGALTAWAFTSIDGRAYFGHRPYATITLAAVTLSVVLVAATWRNAQHVTGRSAGIEA